MCWNTIQDMGYLDVVPAPNEPSLEMMSWLVVHTKSYDMNMRWSEGPRVHWIGSVEFCTAMNDFVHKGDFVKYK